MAEQEKIDILLYGLGAIGSFYAFIFSRSPHVRLTVVARSNYEAVKTNGLIIDSQNHGKHTVYPHKVAKTAAEVSGKYDYVICTAKALDQDKLAKQLKPVIGEGTTIVIIQNGVGNEAPFQRLYPRSSIISCVTWVGATQTSPGIVSHTKSENTELGLCSNPSLSGTLEKSRLDMFEQLLSSAQTPYTLYPDIQIPRWSKVVWNCAWNSLTTLTLLDTQSWLASSPDATPLTEKLMREVISVARKAGVMVEYDLVGELMAKIRGMPGIGSSMQTDYLKGREMEVDVILGTPVREARRLGMGDEVPVLETLYTVLRAQNVRIVRDREKT